MISLKVRSSLTCTAANSSARVSATCSHIALDRATPALAISVPITFFTSGMHDPQDVPARVHAFTAATSWQPVLGHGVRGWRPRVTLLHEQTAACVRQLGLRPLRAGALGQQPQGRVAAELGPDHRAQRGVRRRVADEHPAEQRAGVVGDDDLRVDPRDRVGVDELERAGRGREGVAERRDVDPEQLELGRQVGPGEGRVAAEQPVDGHLGHGVARRDQAQAAALDAGDLADGVDPRVLGDGTRCRRPLPPRGPVEQPGRRGELVARPHARGEDDDVDRQRLLDVGEPDAGHPAVARRRRSTRMPRASRTSTPIPSMIRRSASPPPSSTCSAISRGANSTTVVAAPSPTSAPAASRPSRPPPTTAPRTGRPSSLSRCRTQSRRATTSSTVR